MRGVFEGKSNVGGFTLSSITNYYFLLIPAAGALMTHPEIPIYRDDIEKGELAGRLLKPLSYYWQRFYSEIPVRVFQSISGILIYWLLTILYGSFLKISLSFEQIILLFVIVSLAYMVCFTFKMITGIVALWTTDIRGLRETIDALVVVFAGYIVPVSLLPGVLEKIAFLTPFPYIIYFPVIAIQGKLSINSMISVIAVQAFWLFVLSIFFRYQWKKGLMKYADLGH